MLDLILYMYIIKKEKGIDMNRKNVKLTVKQHNLLEDKNDTIFKGTAQLDTSENHKVYYQEADKTTVILKLSETEGQLLREGEVLTEINFDLNADAVCKVSTDVGDIFMDVKTLDISLENNNIYLYYELYQEHESVGKFKLRLEWENE